MITEGFLFFSIYLCIDPHVYQCLIKPNRLVNRPCKFIDPAANVENILPALLRQPGSDLRAAVAVMAAGAAAGFSWVRRRMRKK